MTRVWIIGAGQLGAMLRHAGAPLALDVRPIALDSMEIPALEADDIVTAEIEHWPDTPATRALADHPGLVNGQVFSRLADRLTQKQLIDALGLATAPWLDINFRLGIDELYSTLGHRALLKRRRGGYDGRGQLWINRDEDGEIPDDWRGLAIAEQGIDFHEELSLVGVRDRNGSKAYYPLALNLHTEGILAASIAPLKRLQPLQRQAEDMLGALLDELDYVGVMAMECFRVNDRLLVNELAPRVHNSGHWTQAGSSISQFEAHLRALCGLPIPTPNSKNLTLMVNLIGVERDNRWLEIPEAELYWYAKEVRPGRKLGHISLCFNDISTIEATLLKLATLLPDRYQSVVSWAIDHLKD